jgi:toluene monooxygenase system protein A
MPKLQRRDYYDTARDMNWAFSYVNEDEVFPEELSKSFGIKGDEWWGWDEPYKLTYREYVHNQAGKDDGIYSIRSTIARSNLYDNLDVGWKSAIKAHYGAIPVPEYFASIGEARMARFGRAAAWRNMATFGTLDECRHGQAQIYFPYCLLGKDPQFDWAHKAMHTNEWGVIAARSLFDDMFTANDAVSTAIQLTFTFETGFTNLQFLGMASDALHVGDIEFGALISSIQTDEARHSQQGEPTLRIMIQNGRKAEAQKLVDQMFWRSWKLFALLTGISMDYYTPLESRTMSFKEFMQDWICRQFMDQFKDLGMDLPWYWEKHFLPELDWVHHAYHMGVWFWRPTVWWNPDAGVSAAERDWLEQKYPGWNARFGKLWDVIADNVRAGRIEKTYPATLPIVCNCCHIPICSPSVGQAPRITSHNGRKLSFCCEVCEWVWKSQPERYDTHLSVVDRFLAGHIQPPNLEGALQYMGITPEVAGNDAEGYAWNRMASLAAE